MQASPSLSNHPSTRRGLPIMHSSRSKAGSSATSWPLARHKVSHTALTKCRWPCQLGSTDQLRTTPDLMVSTGALLWPKTTTPSRTTQAVIYLSWSVEVPRLRVRWDPPFQSLPLRLPNSVWTASSLGACKKPAAHDWTAEEGTSSTPPARSRAARTPLTSTPTSGDSGSRSEDPQTSASSLSAISTAVSSASCSMQEGHRENKYVRFPHAQRPS